MPKHTVAAKRSRRLASVANLAFITEQPKRSQAKQNPEKKKEKSPSTKKATNSHSASFKSLKKPNPVQTNTENWNKTHPKEVENTPKQPVSNKSYKQDQQSPRSNSRSQKCRTLERDPKTAIRPQTSNGLNETFDVQCDASVDETGPSKQDQHLFHDVLDVMEEKTDGIILERPLACSTDDEMDELVFTDRSQTKDDSREEANDVSHEERNDDSRGEAIVDSDGETMDGKTKDGESKDGESKDGESKDGESKDGETEDGESKDEESCDKDLKAVVARQKRKIKKLQRENARVVDLNLHYQESLTQRPGEVKFLDVPGFPDNKWLLDLCATAGDSDYIFVKELVMKLWPEGCGNATVTGRNSNNPSGRKKPDDVTSRSLQLPETTQLDPKRVDYIKDRLFERRIILKDKCHTAQNMVKNVPKHIARAIANNPKLRASKN